jgi:EAL domain-containing protein (putative c-di-GMP-specific phosphodiesterase class I)
MDEVKEHEGDFLLPALRDIIEVPRLRTVFQPIVDLRTQKVLAYEALSRGPEGGPLEMPTDLYHQASRHSLLAALDEACCKGAILNARQLPEGVRLFVNVLPTALAGEELGAQALAEVMAEAGLAPERFVLELTESVPLPDQEILTRALAEYRELGASIAIDDYGTGFANLASLVAIRPEFLKLDRSLTQDLPRDCLRQEILRAMCTITSSYGAAVIAEGIETPEQLEALLELGVPYGQGELLAHPEDGFPLPLWP